MTSIKDVHREIRQEGLLPNYRLVQPTSRCRLTPLDPISDIREPFTFSSDSHLHKPPEWKYPREQLQLHQDVAVYLSATTQPPTIGISEEATDDAYQPFLVAKRNESYLEVPVVGVESLPRTPHAIVLPKGMLERFPVDEGGDGGVQWSVKVKRDVTAYVEKKLIERLDVDQDTLRLLQEAAKEPKEPGGFGRVEKMPRNLWLEPMSPPLLPMEIRCLPKNPSLKDAVLGLEPLGVASAAELKHELLRPHLEQDSAFDEPSSPCSPEAYVKFDGLRSSSPIKRLLLPDAQKVEAPITPPKEPQKRVRIREIIEQDKSLKFEESSTKDDEVATFYENVARPQANRVRRAIQQEQLQEADTTQRVDVPIMEFLFSSPPWEVEKTALLQNLRSWAGQKTIGRRWPGTKVIESRLHWVPFSTPQARLPKESIEWKEDEILGFLPTKNERKEAEDALISGFKGIRLDPLFGVDEEIPYGSPLPMRKDDAALPSLGELTKLRKRKLSAVKPIDLGPETQTLPTRSKRRCSKGGEPAVLNRFSAMSALDNFMAVRARKPLISRKVHSPVLISRGKQLALPKTPNKLNPPPPPKTPNREPSLPQPLLSLPTPFIPPSPPTGTFVVSAVVLANFNLLRDIRFLYPQARFIERDYSIPVASGDRMFDPTASLVIDDAEIILTPTTGLTYTTLEALRKRPLPGARAAFPAGEEVKKRLLTLHRRYERLIAIVQTPQAYASSISDSEAVTSFVGFTAALRETCTIVVRLVEGGGTELAKWIVTAMLQGNQETGCHKFRFLENESLWEIFLRKAGLNSFAAQAIMSECALPEFITMDPRERERRFAGIVGERVLSRVESVLEANWKSC